MIETLRKTPLSLLLVTISVEIPGIKFLGKAKNSLTFCWPRLSKGYFLFSGSFSQRLRSLNFSFDPSHSNYDGLYLNLEAVMCFPGDFYILGKAIYTVLSC